VRRREAGEQVAGHHRRRQAHESGVKAALLVARPRVRGGLHLVHGGERRLRPLQERLPGAGERYPARIAIEQSDPGLGLEPGDRLGERRLGEL
jgi:hypothetical protein